MKHLARPVSALAIKAGSPMPTALHLARPVSAAAVKEAGEVETGCGAPGQSGVSHLINTVTTEYVPLPTRQTGNAAQVRWIPSSL